MSRVVRTFITLLVTVAAVLVAAPAAADDAVTVEVRSISAIPEGDEFDDQLADIEGRLRRGFENYSSFHHLDRQLQQVERGESVEFTLPTEDGLTLEYKGRADDFVRLGLDLEDRLTTTLRATPGSTFFQAGLRYEDGLLVLAITIEDDDEE